MAKYALSKHGYRWEQVQEPKPSFRQWKDALGDEYYAPIHVYRYALVGYGSSIAYYLDALAQQSVSGYGFDYSTMLIFGKVDAWDATVRGEGFINHEAHNLLHWTKGVPAYSKEYYNRAKFAEDNSSIITKAINRGAGHYTSPVIAVRRRGHLFEIVTKQRTHYAAKVILATGAGPHYELGYERYVPKLSPDIVNPNAGIKQLQPFIMDLDRFMRAHPRPKGKLDSERLAPTGQQVIVHGPNAGIDAVQRAWQLGYDVLFFMSSADAAWLQGNRLAVSPSKSRLNVLDDEEEPRFTRVEVTRDDKVYVKLAETGDSVQVKIVNKNSETKGEYSVAFYVIALGQNPTAPGAIGDLLRAGGFRWGDLEPIYDRNQVFGLPYQTVLGVQTKKTTVSRGVQIIGAAAQSLSMARDDEAKALAGDTGPKKLEHNYREQFAITRRDENVVDLKEQQAIAYVETHIQEAEAYHQKAATDRGPAPLGIADLMDHQIDPYKVPFELQKMTVPKKESALSTPANPAATAIASVLAAAQLGGVRAAAAALQGMVPNYITQGLTSSAKLDPKKRTTANFTTDDRTMLAIYITLNFPDIPPKVANKIVEKIVGSRRDALDPKKPRPPNSLDSTKLGYSDEQSEELKEWLVEENDAWLKVVDEDWEEAEDARAFPMD